MLAKCDENEGFLYIFNFTKILLKLNFTKKYKEAEKKMRQTS